MKEYEVFVEDINHCGGTKYAKKEFREIQAESPEAYVRAHIHIQSVSILTIIIFYFSDCFFIDKDIDTLGIFCVFYQNGKICKILISIIFE